MFDMRERVMRLAALSFAAAILLAGAGPAAAQQTRLEGTIIQAPRISPQEAHRQVSSGQAILVCAYEDEKRCGTMMLEGAITLKEFESRLSGFKKEQPIIFYCA